MYETGLSGAKLYHDAQQSLKQQKVSNFGGCNAEKDLAETYGNSALKVDGLSTSIQRATQMGALLKEQAAQIAYFFAVADPQEPCGRDASASPKHQLDSVVDDMNRVSAMLDRVLEHVRS